LLKTGFRPRLRTGSLDFGVTEFDIPPGDGARETFTIVPKNPSAAADLANGLTTQVLVE
jgi:hypothetical protein